MQKTMRELHNLNFFSFIISYLSHPYLLQHKFHSFCTDFIVFYFMECFLYARMFSSQQSIFCQTRKTISRIFKNTYIHIYCKYVLFFSHVDFRVKVNQGKSGAERREVNSRRKDNSRRWRCFCLLL